MINVDKQMMIENFPKLKRRDHSPNRDEFIDVSLDPPYFSLDSPFKGIFLGAPAAYELSFFFIWKRWKVIFDHLRRTACEPW